MRVLHWMAVLSAISPILVILYLLGKSPEDLERLHALEERNQKVVLEIAYGFDRCQSSGANMDLCRNMFTGYTVGLNGDKLTGISQ